MASSSRQGSKALYTSKQKRQAAHIAQSELASGRTEADAERIAWATVNKQDHGGKLGGRLKKKS